MGFVLPDIWTIAALVLALGGVAAAMISVPGPSHREFWVARICFVAATVLFLAKIAIWGVEDLTGWRIALVALLGAIVAVALAFGLQWVNSKQAAILTSKANGTAPDMAADLEILFKPAPPYEITEISHGRILSTVRIGLKAVGKPLSNCKLYIEKMAPDPGIPGGLPILLAGGDFILWPHDPERLYDIASHWNHVPQFRFNSTGGWWAETMNYIDDEPIRAIEIKFVATELTKTFLFKLRTDESKRLHLERIN